MNTSLPDELFRAYDIRGIYEDTLTLADAGCIGRTVDSTGEAMRLVG